MTGSLATGLTATRPAASGPVGVGIVGAGVISTEYLRNLTQFPDVAVLRIADLDVARAETQATVFGVPGHGTVDELLADPAIEIVVNLTIPAAHAEVGHGILAAGKHVWSEKPYALDRAAGRALLDDAAERGLRTACAPDTFLGAGLQTLQRVVDSGAIGTPLSALAILQSAGPESWHPNPEFLFDVGAGPLFDMGPYYLTALVQQFGPIDRVTGVASTASPTRVIGSGPRAGTRFAVGVPSQYSAMIEFESGASAQLLLSFDSQIGRTMLELSGSIGSLTFPDPNHFDGDPSLWQQGAASPRAVAAAGSTYGRGSGVLELARAIREGRPERASGALAFHVLDAMVSITESAAESRTVVVESTAERPAPLPEDWDPTRATLTADAVL